MYTLLTNNEFTLPDLNIFTLEDLSEAHEQRLNEWKTKKTLRIEEYCLLDFIVDKAKFARKVKAIKEAVALRDRIYEAALRDAVSKETTQTAGEINYYKAYKKYKQKYKQIKYLR